MALAFSSEESEPERSKQYNLADNVLEPSVKDTLEGFLSAYGIEMEEESPYIVIRGLKPVLKNIKFTLQRIKTPEFHYENLFALFNSGKYSTTENKKREPKSIAECIDDLISSSEDRIRYSREAAEEAISNSYDMPEKATPDKDYNEVADNWDLPEVEGDGFFGCINNIRFEYLDKGGNNTGVDYLHDPLPLAEVDYDKLLKKLVLSGKEVSRSYHENRLFQLPVDVLEDTLDTLPASRASSNNMISNIRYDPKKHKPIFAYDGKAKGVERYIMHIPFQHN